ncbi:MAG: ADOP family duplicated permease [Gemmatimonadales bacterium]
MIGWLGERLARIAASLRRWRVDEAVSEEFRFHLDQATERHIRRGLPPAEARRRALEDFGTLPEHRERAADEQRHRRLEAIVDDVRFGARALRSSPRFATTLALTIALAVGANSAIFSVIDGVLLKPLPLPDPDRLAFVGWDNGGGRVIHAVSPFQLDFLGERATTIEAIGTYRTRSWSRGERDAPETVRAAVVSRGLLGAVGLPVRLGRAFAEEEYRPGADVVLVSDAFWRATLGGAREVLGRTLRFDGESRTVVGVLDPRFQIPGQREPAEVLAPLAVEPNRQDGQNLNALIRTRPGVSPSAVRTELERLSERFRVENPDLVDGGGDPSAPPRFVLASFQDVFVGDLRTTLWILFGAIGFVTLIGCANAANLLIARGIARERELAVRTALGAGRGRILQQLVIESLLISLAAGALGLLLARAGIEALLALAPSALPREGEIALDGRVLGFTTALSIAVGVLFGAINALAGTKRGLLATLGRAGRGGSGRRRGRETLIVAQTAIAVVLIVSAALLVESFARLRSVDPGFDPEGVVAIRLGRLPSSIRGEKLVALETRVVEALERRPGVVAAAAAANFPFERGLNFPISIAEREDVGEGAVEWRTISPGYFETLAVPLLRGRAFSPADDPRAPRVAIVNAAFAERYWPGEDPIGKRVEIGRWRGEWLRPVFEGGEVVIGVVADLREIGLASPARRTVYTPRAQWSEGLDWPRFLARGPADASLVADLGAVLGSIDDRIPPPSLETMPALLSASIAAERFRTALISSFALAALLLTAVGVYGVVAALVGQRTREIGIRMALGAPAATVLRLVIGRGLGLVAVGCALGGVGALGLTRMLRGMLFSVAPDDPVAHASAMGILLAVAALAMWLPARRATRVNPVETLRAE